MLYAKALAAGQIRRRVDKEGGYRFAGENTWLSRYRYFVVRQSRFKKLSKCRDRGVRFLASPFGYGECWGEDQELLRPPCPR